MYVVIRYFCTIIPAAPPPQSCLAPPSIYNILIKSFPLANNYCHISIPAKGWHRYFCATIFPSVGVSFSLSAPCTNNLHYRSHSFSFKAFSKCPSGSFSLDPLISLLRKCIRLHFLRTVCPWCVSKFSHQYNTLFITVNRPSIFHTILSCQF